MKLTPNGLEMTGTRMRYESTKQSHSFEFLTRYPGSMLQPVHFLSGVPMEQSPSQYLLSYLNQYLDGGTEDYRGAVPAWTLFANL